MNRKQLLINLLIGMFGGLIVLIGAWVLWKPNLRASISDYQQSAQTRYASFTADGVVNFQDAAALALPTVVHIKSIGQTGPSRNGDFPLDDPFFPFRDFFEGPRGRGPGLSSGSGVILSADGYIVTNNHVIDRAAKIEVNLHDNRSFEATVIGTDPSTDLALLKIDAKGLDYLKYGDSDALKVGEWVLAVGNPFNLTSTVTAGIVSAKARNINILQDQFKIESFIQTDAAVNPGNSGGALINIAGELVGINTAIASQTGSYAGYSFAVPVSIVRKVVDDLMNYGEVQRGFLGVMIQDVNAQLAEENNLDVTKGVFVAKVNEGSSAQDAGLKVGDVIVEVEGQPVSTSSELQEIIGRKRPGDKVRIVVLRKNKSLNFEVVLKNKSGDTKVIARESGSLLRELGAEFENIKPEKAAELGLEWGVRVKSVTAGKLRSAGVQPGFVITHIDKKPVYSAEDVEKQLINRTGAVLIEGVYSRTRRAAYALMF
jgi:Do/DeqQ family serine protease